jgi:hypothetical protein
MVDQFTKKSSKVKENNEENRVCVCAADLRKANDHVIEKVLFLEYFGCADHNAFIHKMLRVGVFLCGLAVVAEGCGMVTHCESTYSSSIFFSFSKNEMNFHIF